MFEKTKRLYDRQKLIMKPEPESVQIPIEVYQDLVNHLEVHATTDTWAKSCLDRLTEQSIAVYVIGRMRYEEGVFEEDRAL